MSGVCSSCAIEIKQIDGSKGNLAVKKTGGKTEQFAGLGISDIKSKLDSFFQNPETANNVEKLDIEILAVSPVDKSIVFMDTPGAEETALETDTKRALEILFAADVIIFCMRADNLESKDDAQFYKEHISPLRPINVIGFRDEAKDVDEDSLIATARGNYGTIGDDTCAISAKKAHSAFEEWKKTNLDDASHLCPDKILNSGNMNVLTNLILK